MKNANHDELNWREAAALAISNLAKRYKEFTADEVWAELRRIRPGVSLLDPRTLGTAMLHAQRHKIIRTSGRYTRSKSDLNHHRIIPIWESLLYSVTVKK